MPTTKYIAIDEAGEMRNIQISVSDPVLTSVEVLTAIAEDKPAFIPNFASRVGNELVRYGKTSVATVLWTRLLDVQINSLWTTRTGDGHIVPQPLDRGGSHESQALSRCVRRKWVVPLPWKLYIAYVIQPDGTETPYMVIRSEKGETHQPPLGNVFNDARICLGDNIAALKKTPGLFNKLEAAIDYFSASAFTSDILPPQFSEWVHYKQEGGELIQQPPDTRTPLLIVDNWFTQFIDKFGW